MLIYQIVVTLLLLNFVFLVARNLRDYAVLPPDQTPARPDERLFVLIPARNEAENIGDCLNGLLAQPTQGAPFPFTLLALDDGSEDGTDAIIKEIASRDNRVHLLRGKPIEAGWAGKVWACTQLGTEALNRGADWLLFLDADTRAKPELLRASLAHAQETGAGMVSAFPYQVTGTFWERVVLPMLHFLIITFLPIRMVWESKFPQLVAACGQFELFSAEAYRAVGGHGSIPHSFHDGLQLARRVKASGRIVRLCDASGLISCRMYAGGKAVWNGFTRNAYEGLGGIAPLIVMSGLQTVLFLLPFVFGVLGVGCWVLGVQAFRYSGIRVFGFFSYPLPLTPDPFFCLIGAQILLILLIRMMQARRFGHGDSIWLHPLSVAALVVIQWASFWKTLRKSHVAWKGRVYS